jgi:hypothetical protein
MLSMAVIALDTAHFVFAVSVSNNKHISLTS